jgi:DNA-binding response OmpR family regulator
MTVLLVTADLMTSSRISGLAHSLGVKLNVADSVDGVCANATASVPKLAILDLASPLVDVSTLVPRLRALSPSPHIIAFGPHVHDEKLAAARTAGCDEVLTRGQFHAQTAEILSRFAARESGQLRPRSDG